MGVPVVDFIREKLKGEEKPNGKGNNRRVEMIKERALGSIQPKKGWRPMLKLIGRIIGVVLAVALLYFSGKKIRSWFGGGTAEASVVSTCRPTVGPLCALDTTQFRAMSGGLLPLREISRSKVCDVDAKTNLPRCADLEVVKKHP